MTGRWLSWRWGNPEAGTASPQQIRSSCLPEACSACRMVLRKGEAPYAPEPTGAGATPREGSALDKPKPWGANGGKWCCRAVGEGCICARPQRVSSSCSRASDCGLSEAGWVFPYTPTQVPCPEPSAGLGPAALPATWSRSYCSLVLSQGLALSSWVRGTLQCCLCPSLRSQAL